MAHVQLYERNGLYSVCLNFLDTVIRSVPQTIEDMYADCCANREFLVSRKIAKIFFGDEPMVNVEYQGDENILISKFKSVGGSTKKIQEVVVLDEILIEFNSMIKILEKRLGVDSDQENKLSAKIADDMKSGAYDIYLKH